MKDRRETAFDRLAEQPWWVRWSVIGICLLLWAVIFNVMLFGWLL